MNEYCDEADLTKENETLIRLGKEMGELLLLELVRVCCGHKLIVNGADFDSTLKNCKHPENKDGVCGIECPIVNSLSSFSKPDVSSKSLEHIAWERLQELIRKKSVCAGNFSIWEKFIIPVNKIWDDVNAG